MMYKGILSNKGKIVAEEDLFEHALEQCGVAISDKSAPEHEEFREMLIEWFFSSDWVPYTEEEREECKHGEV